MTRTTSARSILVISAVLLAAVVGTRAQAQGEQPPAQGAAPIDRTPEGCVLMNRVARNVAANNSQVVFFIKGGTQQYLNVLDGACEALTKGENKLVFHYRTGSMKITRLCDTDSFTVERQTSRIGCGLGKFIPITAEEAAALTGQPVAAPPATNSANGQPGGQSSGADKPE